MAAAWRAAALREACGAEECAGADEGIDRAMRPGVVMRKKWRLSWRDISFVRARVSAHIITHHSLHTTLHTHMRDVSVRYRTQNPPPG
jgi:deoxyribose-phosphate aldolase